MHAQVGPSTGGAHGRSPDLARVAEAANFLILSPAHERLTAEVVSCVDNWDRTPRAFAGKQAVLNALVDVGVDNRASLDRMLDLIEERRKLLPSVRKIDYQRELMRTRRAREYKALLAHERLHGRVRGAPREAFFRDMRARWAAAKTDHMVKAAGQRGRELTYQEKLDATAAFWAWVDANLADATRAKG